jgi:hypothetical protein
MYCCSVTVVVMLLIFCWCAGFALVLCVAVPNVTCILLCFYIVVSGCVLPTVVHSLQCSKYWVICINVCVIRV